MTGYCPSRIWNHLEDSSKEFVWYLADHPDSALFHFSEDTGKTITRSEFRKMLVHNVMVASGKIQDKYTGWVNVYRITADTAKVLKKEEAKVSL